MNSLAHKSHWPSRTAGHSWCRLGAVVALAALTVACEAGSVRGAQSQGPAAVSVKVLTAQLVPIKDSTEYVATLKSRDSAVIMPQVEGQITDIYVHSGTRVSAGTDRKSVV